MTIRTYTIGCCQNCGRDNDICEDTLLCRECLGIEAPSPPPGPPEEIFGGLRPGAASLLGFDEMCQCGHEEGLHQTPGMECAVLDCQCGHFSPPPGPPEEILGDLRPESRSAYLNWLMGETEDFDG